MLVATHSGAPAFPQNRLVDCHPERRALQTQSPSAYSSSTEKMEPTGLSFSDDATTRTEGAVLEESRSDSGSEETSGLSL